jgi:hypothetical protein
MPKHKVKTAVSVRTETVRRYELEITANAFLALINSHSENEGDLVVPRLDIDLGGCEKIPDGADITVYAGEGTEAHVDCDTPICIRWSETESSYDD